MSDWRYVHRTAMEVAVVVRFNWNPGCCVTADCPGEDPHPEDLTAFVVDADGVEVEIPLSHADRVALAEDIANTAEEGFDVV